MPAKSSSRATRTCAVAGAAVGWGRSPFRRAICCDPACGGVSREEAAPVRDGACDGVARALDFGLASPPRSSSARLSAFFSSWDWRRRSAAAAASFSAPPGAVSSRAIMAPGASS
eukprot:92185-Heterocapsa_arctica.AAC.1